MDTRTAFNDAASALADATSACDRASHALRSIHWHGDATECKRLATTAANLRTAIVSQWDSGPGS